MEKAERHQDTFSTLAEMRRNLQTKVISLLNKRDTLRKKLDGEDMTVLLEDEAT